MATNSGRDQQFSLWQKLALFDPPGCSKWCRLVLYRYRDVDLNRIPVPEGGILFLGKYVLSEPLCESNPARLPRTAMMMAASLMTLAVGYPPCFKPFSSPCIW